MHVFTVQYRPLRCLAAETEWPETMTDAFHACCPVITNHIETATKT